MEQQQYHQLVKNECSSYKLIIPDEVEAKIRYLCSKINNIEWSGVLFYEYENAFKENFIITCKDLVLMDVGQAATTSFEINADVIAYATDNDLLDCQMGLVHSHHSMTAYFSSTDHTTLQKEGSIRNIFLSLIVNNAGQYVAAITRKIESCKEIAENKTYRGFNDSNEKENLTYSLVKTYVEYFDLKIEKSSYNTIDARIKELREQKKINISSPLTNNSSLFSLPPSPSQLKTKNNSLTPITYSDEKKPFYWSEYDKKEPTFWDLDNKAEKIAAEIDKPKKEIKEVSTEEIDVAIKATAVQIITSSILLSDIKDINKAVSSMNNLYSKRFPKWDDFERWSESYIDFLLLTDGFEFEEDHQNFIEGLYEYLSDIAEGNSNKYLQRFIEEIGFYLQDSTVNYGIG